VREDSGRVRPRSGGSTSKVVRADSRQWRFPGSEGGPRQVEGGLPGKSGVGVETPAVEGVTPASGGSDFISGGRTLAVEGGIAEGGTSSAEGGLLRAVEGDSRGKNS
jgi:hypothetical protein